MANNKLIAVYGNEADRLRAALVAEKLGHPSISKMLLAFIRNSYREHFGDTNPAHLKELSHE